MPLFAQAIQSASNPAIGVLIFVLGGLAGAVFYLPFKKVKGWAWESYWMIYAVVGLVIVPWVLALSTSPNVMAVLQAAPAKQLGYCFLCGAAWGVGGLTWGLMIRYLGVGLGLAIGCGLCSAAGTLIPPALKGEFAELLKSQSGLVSLGAVLISLIGIVLVGGAGMSKESELPEEEKKKAVAEFNFKKGMIIAIFSGLMSAAMSLGLQGGPVLEATACPLFTSSQISNDKESVRDFIARLKEPPANSFYSFLDIRFSPETKKLLTTFTGEKGETALVQDALSHELNLIVQKGGLYQPERFADVRLSKGLSEAVLAKNVEAVPERLNRALLETALPTLIKVKSPQLAVLRQSITPLTWRGMTVLVVVLLGGFLINFGYCLFLNLRNRTTGDYINSSAPLAANLFFAGLAGAVWCSQFICFKTGEPAMGDLSYVGWAVLMASAILFSTLIGIVLGEWRNTSRRTKMLLILGLLFLVASAVVSGYSGYLKQ